MKIKGISLIGRVKIPFITNAITCYIFLVEVERVFPNYDRADMEIGCQGQYNQRKYSPTFLLRRINNSVAIQLGELEQDSVE